MTETTIKFWPRLQGLVLFDSRLKQTILTSQHDGLVNDSIAHVSLKPIGALTNEASPPPPPQGQRAATRCACDCGGLTEFSGGRARSLTAFTGWPAITFTARQ